MTKNLVKFYPNMTSDTSPYMTTSSQLYDSLRLPYMAFDGTSSYWASKAVSGWLKIDFLENKKLSNIYIKGDVTPRYSIKDFTIEVSNDDIIWETIQTVTNVSWASSEVKVFSISLAEKGYRYYKINITDNNSGLYSRIVDIYFDELMPINKTLILHDGEYITFKNQNKTTLEWYETKMTSNTAPAPFVASASSSMTAYPTWKAFDGLTNGGSAWSSDGFTSPQWIQIDYGVVKKTNFLSLTFRNSTDVEGMVKKFQVLASNNGIDYTQVLEVNSETNWTPMETRTFKFNETVNYRYYKLNVLENNGITTYTIIGEVKYGLEEISIDTSKPPVLEMISPTLPTQQQFLTDGMDELTPLLSRKVTTLELMQMQSKSDILPVGSDGKVFSRIVELSKYLDIRSMKVEVK